MKFCEENGIEFIIGLARNNRLQGEIAQEMEEAKAQFEALPKEEQKATRVYKDFSYQTLQSWEHARRVSGSLGGKCPGAPRRMLTPPYTVVLRSRSGLPNCAITP